MSISDERLEQFAPRGRRVIVRAQERAGTDVTSWDVLVSLLQNGGPGIWRESLQSIGIELSTLYDYFTGPPPSSGRHAYAGEVLELALREAARLGQARAGCEALLLGLIRQGDRFTGQVLIELGADLEWTRWEVERLIRQFARNLTQAAIKGELPPVIGREREIERILHILFRDPLKVPVLVGEPGIGKTSVVYGLAQRIAANKVPQVFASTQVIQLDMSAAIRTLNSEELDELISHTLTQRDVLVFIDDDQLRGNPVLANDDARIIGAMTPVNYSRMTHDLRRTLVPMTADELSAEQTVQILEGLLQRGEKRHQLPITDGAMGAAAWYAREKLEAPVPGSAAGLLDEAVSLGEFRGLGSIDEKTVAEAVASMLSVAPDQIEEAPRVQAPVVARVAHDKEIWEMS